ncbi:MAG: tyrosine-type recombinase/integrase [Actinomycetota bacterium]
MGEFVEHRLRHRGVAKGTTPSDARTASVFLTFLHRRRRGIARVRVTDLDDFVTGCSRRWRPRTVAGMCSTLRAFLSFLHLTGRARRDFASLVVSPRIRRCDRPSRALAWTDVRRILRAIDVTEGLGRRDFAMFLMMATYGMGAGEVRSLKLDDIDWVARTMHVHRPKTGTETVLPLLDPVARALGRYLRERRPGHSQDREVFVSHRMPHAKLSGASAIRYRLAKYAALAGVHADFLGTHVFRHTHATRQIEGGATAKIVGDILGHRRPESTSTYVRSAIRGLRAIALPVPR